MNTPTEYDNLVEQWRQEAKTYKSVLCKWQVYAVIITALFAIELAFSTDYFIKSQAQIAELNASNTIYFNKLSRYEDATGK